MPSRKDRSSRPNLRRSQAVKGRMPPSFPGPRACRRPPAAPGPPEHSGWLPAPPTVIGCVEERRCWHRCEYFGAAEAAARATADAAGNVRGAYGYEVLLVGIAGRMEAIGILAPLASDQDLSYIIEPLLRDLAKQSPTELLSAGASGSRGDDASYTGR